MITRYQLVNSDNEFIQNGLAMDKATLETMKQLNLKCIKSKRNRSIDRARAIKVWGKQFNLKEFAIHHMMDGRIGLVPIELHKSLHHYGYLWRINHTAGDI